MLSHPKRSAFLAGAQATIPLIAGAIPFGFIFGAFSVSSGLSPAATLGMSAIVFAGSSQFIGVSLLASGLSIPLIILTTFVVNMRHALYAASLAPYMKHLPQRWLLPLGFWLTDETYAVVVTHYTDDSDPTYNHWFHLGSSVAMYSNWQLVTLIGIVAGQSIPDPASWGLEFAMIVTFIGIVVPLIRNRPMLASVVVAGIVSVLAYGMPNKLGLMVAAVSGIAAGILAESLSKPEVTIEEVAI